MTIGIPVMGHLGLTPQSIHKFGTYVVRATSEEEAARLLKNGDVILTHCNISGLMPLIGEFAKKQGKRISFFATETRPYLQGSRLTAWELKRAGFDVTLITDNMVASVMSQKKVNKVIVGTAYYAVCMFRSRIYTESVTLAL